MRTTDHENISNKWVPTYFTFRAPSEHTFAGKHTGDICFGQDVAMIVLCPTAVLQNEK